MRWIVSKIAIFPMISSNIYCNYKFIIIVFYLHYLLLIEIQKDGTVYGPLIDEAFYALFLMEVYERDLLKFVRTKIEEIDFARM